MSHREHRRRIPAALALASAGLAFSLSSGCGSDPGDSAVLSLETIVPTAPGTAPVVLSLTTSPAEVTTDSLIAASVQVADADGDPVNLTWVWYVDGAPIGAMSALLDGRSWFEKGQHIVAEVTPDDGVLTGAPVRSAPLIVGNTPPGAPEVEVVDGGALTCALRAPAEDPDGDPLSYQVSWTVDGVPFYWAGDGANPGDTVPEEAVHAYARWRCEVVASDGEGEGPAATHELQIALDYPGWGTREVGLGAADVTLAGAQVSDQAGWAVAGAGDLDGDGRDELLVAAPDSDAGGEDAGAVYLVTGAWLAGPEQQLTDTSATLLGTSDGAHVGSAVAGVGDVDGDGVPDLLIGAPGDSEDGSGAVWLVPGGAPGQGARALDDVGVRISGEAAGDYLGSSLAAAGDVDGDGLAELLLGAYGSDQGGYKTGRTYLVDGASLAPGAAVDLADAAYLFEGEATNDWSGYAVAGAGDVDGDGLDDVLIGAPFSEVTGFSAGAAYLILAADLGGSGKLADASQTYYGEAPEDSVGEVLSGAGDLDGDGRADFVLGSRHSDAGGASAGRTYIIFGAEREREALETCTSLTGEGINHQSGSALAAAGDLDGDGLGELLIGARGYDSYRGGAYLFFGARLAVGDSVGLGDAEYVFSGVNPGDFVGQSVAAADANGDGSPDLLIGASGSDAFGDASGGAYVMFSPRP